ncbi:unnamed protein product [Diamesa hyperborea]
MYFNKNWDVTEYSMLTDEEKAVEFRRSYYSMISALCGTVPELFDDEEETIAILAAQPLFPRLLSPESQTDELPEQKLKLKRKTPLYQQPRRERRHFKLPKLKSFAWKGRQ